MSVRVKKATGHIKDHGRKYMVVGTSCSGRKVSIAVGLWTVAKEVRDAYNKNVSIIDIICILHKDPLSVDWPLDGRDDSGNIIR